MPALSPIVFSPTEGDTKTTFQLHFRSRSRSAQAPVENMFEHTFLMFWLLLGGCKWKTFILLFFTCRGAQYLWLIYAEFQPWTIAVRNSLCCRSSDRKYDSRGNYLNSRIWVKTEAVREKSFSRIVTEHLCCKQSAIESLSVTQIGVKLPTQKRCRQINKNFNNQRLRSRIQKCCGRSSQATPTPA